MKEDTKRGLYDFIKKADDKLRGETSLLDIISSHWGIYQMPSTGDDYRYKILGDEIEKHHILNDDWPQDKLYIRILKIYDDEDRLLQFVRDLLNLEDVRIDVALVDDLRNTLHKEGLDIIEMNNYLFIGRANQNNTNRSDNNIPFILCKSEITHVVNFEEKDIQQSKEEICFIVTFNDQWNDYGKYTWFRIYYKNGETVNPIGTIKIMKGEENNTYNTLPERFYYLDDEYCSLGYDISYYKNVYELFHDKSIDFLSLLQDAATNNAIHERNRESYTFCDSLLRMNSSERSLREGRFYANGKDMRNAYCFKFSYAPLYLNEKEERVDIDFGFQYNCPSFRRVMGLIGENGVGKSSLIKSLSKSIARKDNKNFIDEAPIFSKVMVLSFSPFDIYTHNCPDSIIEYRYCGLMKSERELMSQEELIEKFKANLKNINARENADRLLRIWKKIMSDVIAEQIIDSFFEYDDFESRIVDKSIDEFCNNMSSGESIFVYSLTEIIANIRYDSLIMFDEPEQHLHPHAITKLIRAIYKVLDIFESYAIIATHSPLVIREMVSDNVLVFSRADNVLNVAKIGIESFGEDISLLSDIVFRNMNDQKRYEYVVKELVEDKGYGYKEVIEYLEGKHNKLGLSARLMIRNIVENNQKA